MTRFPGLERQILATIEEEGEARPPRGRIGQEWWWQAVASLKVRNLVSVDVRGGVVRGPGWTPGMPLVHCKPFDWMIIDDPIREDGMIDATRFAFEPLPGAESLQSRVAVTDLRARCEMLVKRWKKSNERAAIDLEEVLEETAQVNVSASPEPS